MSGLVENNLFLVKRLIQRTDMRNADPAQRRYTSLAWAAVQAHEEIFEFLLTAGHDDEELSKVRLSPFLFLCATRPRIHPLTSSPPGLGERHDPDATRRLQATATEPVCTRPITG